jgi:thiamine biosynthesis protein ThiS
MITVNDNKIEWHEGMTVQDAIDAMRYDFALITVTVDNVFVHPLDYTTTQIADGSDVRALHLFHGG